MKAINIGQAFDKVECAILIWLAEIRWSIYLTTKTRLPTYPFEYFLSPFRNKGKKLVLFLFFIEKLILKFEKMAIGSPHSLKTWNCAQEEEINHKILNAEEVGKTLLSGWKL